MKNSLETKMINLEIGNLPLYCIRIFSSFLPTDTLSLVGEKSTINENKKKLSDLLSSN